MASGGLALINAVVGDVTTLSTDAETLAAAQAKQATDQTTQASDQASLAAFLSANGPQVVVNDDGSAAIYLAQSAAPGYQVISATVAS